MTKNKVLILVFHVSGGVFDSNQLFKGGKFESKTHNRFICLIRERSAYCHQPHVPPQTAVCPQPWLPWLEDSRTGRYALQALQAGNLEVTCKAGRVDEKHWVSSFPDRSMFLLSSPRSTFSSFQGASRKSVAVLDLQLLGQRVQPWQRGRRQRG